VAAEIRESGWTPKSAVQDAPGKSTAAGALDRMQPEKGAKKRDRTVTEIDVAVATAAYEWALALDGSGERLNDYLWNLYAVAKGGIVDGRTLGLAASMVAAHTKAEVRKRERANRKPSEHVGVVGESRSFALTLDRHFGFETAYGPMSRFIFHDEDGNIFTWKTGGREMVEGDRYILTASVKEHGNYKDIKQTVLTRAGVRPYDEVTFQAMRDEEVRKELGKKVRAKTATPEESAQFKALDVKARAANKDKRAEVAKFMVFETTLRMVHYPHTHDAVAVSGTDLYVDYSEVRRYGSTLPDGRREIVEDAIIHVHANGGWVGQFQGKDALDKARKFVAERLAKTAVSAQKGAS